MTKASLTTQNIRNHGRSSLPSCSSGMAFVSKNTRRKITTNSFILDGSFCGDFPPRFANTCHQLSVRVTPIRSWYVKLTAFTHDSRRTLSMFPKCSHVLVDSSSIVRGIHIGTARNQRSYAPILQCKRRPLN